MIPAIALIDPVGGSIPLPTTGTTRSRSRVRRTTETTHNQPPVYVRHLALTPRVEVG